MPALPAQFTDAKSNIEPKPADVANAIRAHEQVRDALETSDELKAMGVDTVLIGSYARHVSIHRMKDVDVFSKLPDADDVDPGELLDLVAAVLADVFDADDVERQDRSIKVDFPDYDLSVDAVPARPCGNHWEIPDREGGWEETDPLKLAELTSQMNAANDEQYVPTVKLIRQARRANLDDTPPGGLYLEMPPTTRSPPASTPTAPPSTSLPRCRAWPHSLPRRPSRACPTPPWTARRSAPAPPPSSCPPPRTRSPRSQPRRKRR